MATRLSLCLGCVLLSLGSAIVLAKASLPHYYESFKEPSRRDDTLDYVIIEINAMPQKVANGASVSFIRGDQLRVKTAELVDRNQRVGAVNVVGYGSQDGGNPLDDRGELIDTGHFLAEDTWALVDEEGSMFAVVASTGALRHGQVYLRRFDPKLHYIDVSINQQARVIRPGEQVRVKADDFFQVTRVASNINNDGEVQFTIVPQKKPVDAPATENLAHYAIVLRHRSHVFAEVPLLVER